MQCCVLNLGIFNHPKDKINFSQISNGDDRGEILSVTGQGADFTNTVLVGGLKLIKSHCYKGIANC